MPLLSLVLVALIQGITEFLPISSSAHLILLPQLTGMPDQGPSIDIAVHVGTLAAVIIYFRGEVAGMARGGVSLVTGAGGEERAADRRLFVALLIATIPVGIAGLILQETGAIAHLRNVTLIGCTTLGFGILLWVADRYGPRLRPLSSLRLNDAFLIGLAQALALVPGTSRAGITITAARAMGFEREDSARFSMLLAIPTIALAGVLITIDIVRQGNFALGVDALIAAVIAFAFAYLAIALFLRWARRATMTPFVVYRIILGIVLLVFGSSLVAGG